MIYLLILIYMILLPGTILVMLFKITNKLEKMGKQPNKAKKENVMKKRRHTNIKLNDYSKMFNSRYDSYKNNKGLYEPQTPHKTGVNLKKEV